MDRFEARVIRLATTQRRVSLRKTLHGADNYILSPLDDWPWGNLYFRLADDMLPDEDCSPQKEVAVHIGETEACPDYDALGFYWVEFARPAASLAWEPALSINNKPVSIALTLQGTPRPSWRRCYSAKIIVPEGWLEGNGQFSDSPTTVFTWHPAEQERLGPRALTGTIQLVTGQELQVVWDSPFAMAVKYQPDLEAVSFDKMSSGVTWMSDVYTYSIPAHFVPDGAKPEVYLITAKTKDEIRQVNGAPDLQSERGKCNGINLQCPEPIKIPLGSHTRNVSPVADSCACGCCPSVWSRADSRLVVGMYRYVAHEKHCGYNTL
ncbi:MAG: hypothetical protein ACPL7K_09620, partial [Armatimonadota bacterium]